MSKNLRLPQDRYVAALRRQRDRIANGLPFDAVDSDTIGDKFTHAAWGLCSDDPAAWPDAEDHLWPDQFEQHGRVAPKYRAEHQRCPIQSKGGASGCFYSCLIFKNRMGPKSRDQAVALYDAAIAKQEDVA